MTRSFTSFTQAAREAGRSRVYAGIHWTLDVDGRAVAGSKALSDYVVANFLRPVAQPAVAGVVDGTLVVFGGPGDDVITVSRAGPGLVVRANGRWRSTAGTATT